MKEKKKKYLYFFSADNGYIPFLAVSLESLIENISDLNRPNYRSIFFINILKNKRK